MSVYLCEVSQMDHRHAKGRLTQVYPGDAHARHITDARKREMNLLRATVGSAAWNLAFICQGRGVNKTRLQRSLRIEIWAVLLAGARKFIVLICWMANGDMGWSVLGSSRNIKVGLTQRRAQPKWNRPRQALEAFKKRRRNLNCDGRYFVANTYFGRLPWELVATLCLEVLEQLFDRANIFPEP
jgi:hypothetical protein